MECVEQELVSKFIKGNEAVLELGGYEPTSVFDQTSDILIFSIEEIKKMYALKFNLLVADCEGFLKQFFDENQIFCEDFYKLILKVIKMFGKNFRVHMQHKKIIFLKKMLKK